MTTIEQALRAAANQYSRRAEPASEPIESRPTDPERVAKANASRKRLKAAWPDEFADGAQCALSQHFSGDRERGGYAPALFMTRSPKERDSYQRADFVRAMQTLLRDRKIKIVPYGPPSSGYQKLVHVGSESLS